MKTKAKIKVYNAAYRAANKEKIKAARAANKEQIKANKTAYYAANKKEIKAYKARYYETNRGKIKEYNAANAGKKLAHKRMVKYGLSPEAFQLMRLAQKNACGICKDVFSKEPCVDHCHKTGEVRGLLCLCCNAALGGFKDSPTFLKSALDYLEG